MLRDERLDKMKAYILKKGSTSIHEIMDVFQISRATVHRDLAMLKLPEEFQLTRGGIVRQPSSEIDINELPYNEKKRLNSLEKNRIAQAACELIQPHSTIMINNGTTTNEMIEMLKEFKNLHIVTDDLLLAASLTSNPYIDVTVLGGKLRPGYFNVCGYYTEALLRQLHFDQAFLSIDAVDLEIGCTISNLDEVSVKKEILSNSSQSIMLFDHTKFGVKSAIQVCKLNDIDLFITGKELGESKYDAMKRLGHNVVLV